MNLWESVRVSLRALRANKMRSILTMLGIIIGVGAVVAMVGIGNGASASVTSQIKGLGSNLLVVTPGQSNTGGVRGGAGSASTLAMSDVDKIETLSSVKAVAPAVNTQVQVVYSSGNTSTSVIGTTVEYAQIRNISLEQGRFLTQADIDSSVRVAVLGPSVVEDLLGSNQADVLGKVIKLNNVPFQVVGVTASQGSSGMTNNDDIIYVPINTAQGRLIGKKNLNQIYIEATSADLMETAQAQVTTALQRAHQISTGQENDFTVTNQADILETMEDVSQTMTLLLGGIAGISLLVGGIGIMNIMLVSVTERTREIGIRKAIGAKGREILQQFMIEAVILSVLGGSIGIALGAGGSRIAGSLFSMSTSISGTSIVLAFGFSAAIGIIFGVFPARKAALMNPIDALRYE
ncbi:MAG TPA: ABC transporter permease [Desulfitobacteriaceae bacterium]|nr:ABC transporter permease [Desulfitobacteriaceae bacterium]